MSDRSNLFGEIRRMARTSGAVGGIAARVAGERVFGIKTDRAAHAEDLRTILGGLKGPLMKVAQFLSTVPDALPAEYAAELAQLQANAPPMGWNFVRRRMVSELGTDWQAKFAQFGHDAAAAASLGQVHRATSARRHRCRLQAAISRTCRVQSKPTFANCVWRWRSITAWTTPSSTRRSTRNCTERLREELDYEREAAQMRLYRRMLANDPTVHVPVPIAGLLHTPPADDDVARWATADAAAG